MTVRYTEAALRELEEIFSYIYDRSPAAAGAVIDRIDRVATLLSEFPSAGHESDEPGVRVMPLVRYPFVLFYAVSDREEVVVLHVRHSAPKLGEHNEEVKASARRRDKARVV
jgi:toxin ParE1/3/4